MSEADKSERPMNGDAPAAHLAAEMLRNIVLLNQSIEKGQALQSQIAESLQDLADYHETYMRASEILVEQADEGKSKFTILDFAKALCEAAEEVMGPGGDEPGPEDPLVDLRR